MVGGEEEDSVCSGSDGGGGEGVRGKTDEGAKPSSWSGVQWSVAPMKQAVEGETWKCSGCLSLNGWGRSTCLACDSPGPALSGGVKGRSTLGGGGGAGVEEEPRAVPVSGFIFGTTSGGSSAPSLSSSNSTFGEVHGSSGGSSHSSSFAPPAPAAAAAPPSTSFSFGFSSVASPSSAPAPSPASGVPLMFGSTAVSVPAGGRAEPLPAGVSPVIPGVGGGGWSFVGATSMPASMGVGREAEGQESVRSSPGREESG
eukprot:gene12432-15823_t